MMDLEPHGPDTFVGTGPRYPWGGLYGGQIVAQALRAAAATVEPQYRVHSLHAYFIRRGDHAEPVRYEVDRVRNGRSFVTRTVTARQAVGAILSMSASFQVDEEAPDAQTAELPEVPRHDELPQESWTTMFDRVTVPTRGIPGLEGRARGWMRINGDLGDDPVLHACAMAYMSDDYPTDAVVSLQPDVDAPGVDDPYVAFSLDHALWFHRPLRADDWHLTAMVCHGIISSRGLTVGHVFTEQGVHVATISQEVLLRRRRS
ncbi:MAG: thioesterase family protein [Actinobacteria bacterium]|nr:thioesterase family protein [Actinomycetota bacterium]